MNEGKDMANRYGCNYVETSAKTGENIESVFEKLSNEILEVFEKKGKKKETDIKFKNGMLTKTKKKCCKWKFCILFKFYFIYFVFLYRKSWKSG